MKANRAILNKNRGVRCSFFVKNDFKHAVLEYKKSVGKNNFSESVCKLILKEMKEGEND